jgi:hypothetical protein
MPTTVRRCPSRARLEPIPSRRESATPPLDDGAAGIATTIVRVLDRARIAVDDMQVHQPSLDDVFFALTGHPAERERADERDLGEAA